MNWKQARAALEAKWRRFGTRDRAAADERFEPIQGAFEPRYALARAVARKRGDDRRTPLR